MTNEVRPGRRLTPTALALAAALMTGLAACGADPFSFNWNATPNTVSMYSLARPELNLPSAYNFFARSSLPVEAPTATGNWDMAIDTRDGELVLLPPGALGVESRARIAALEGLELDDVTEAPSDTLVFSASVPVPARMGTTYVIRTGQRAGSFGTRCVYFAKMEPVSIDVAAGTMTFREVTNPVCNDRRLVPPR